MSKFEIEVFNLGSLSNISAPKKSNGSAMKILGIVMLTVSLLFILLVATGWPKFFGSFILGTFGLMFYPIMVVTFFIGLALANNKKFMYSKKYVIYLFSAFLCIIAIIHVAVTSKLDTTNYLSYLTDCYNYKNTAGGLLMGIITYAITGLLHDVAAYVIFSILLVVLVVLIVDYLNAVKQFAKLSTETTYINHTEEEIEKLSEEPVVFENVEFEDQEYFEDDVEEEVENPEHDLAREKLGLKKPLFAQQEDLKATTKKSSSILFNRETEEEEKEQKVRRTLFDNKENNSSQWQNNAISVNEDVSDDNAARPPKYIYEQGNNNTGYRTFDGRKGEQPVKSNKNDSAMNRNREYLNVIFSGDPNNKNPIINNDNYKEYKDIISRNNAEKVNNVNNNTVNVQPINQQPVQPIRQINPRRTNTEFQTNQALANHGIEPLSIDGVNNINSKHDFNIRHQEPKQTDNIPNNIFKSNSPVAERFNKKFDIEDSVVIDDIKPTTPVVVEDKPFVSGNIVSNLTDISKDDSVIVDETANTKNENSNIGNYNLPSNFKRNTQEYKQTEIMGAEKPKKKEIIPNFAVSSNYIKPPIDLLKSYENNSEEIAQVYERNIQIIEQVLEGFGIPAKVEAVRRGASVTRYELRMPAGIPVKRINAHAYDIALALAANGDIRIETPIKGKSAVGIEVPNEKRDTIGLREIIDSPEFEGARSMLTFALGKDVDGSVHVSDLARMPHMLVAGSSGSGKSVCLNALILSLIYRTSPEDVRLLLVDPKLVELSIFNGLPHMLIPKAITQNDMAMNAFDWLIDEMERRYLLFQQNYVKNILEYNNLPEVVSKKYQKIPYIVLIVDEFADLVVTMNKKELEERIVRLTQKARAAGIHLILATQRPSVDVITGTIKINLPARIAFKVTSFVDSKTILDQAGAEKLLGYGDMLYSPTDSEPVRIQGAFVNTPEVKAVVDFIKNNNESEYDANIEHAIEVGKANNNAPDSVGVDSGGSGGEFDVLMPDALKLVIENGQASISMLQRRFSIGFNRAARIIDQMELAKFIAPADGSKTRNVYISMEDYNKLYGEG